MRLTIYLLRRTVADLDRAILERHIENGTYTEIRSTADLPFPCRAWLQQNKETEPRWLEWLSTAFDLEDVELANRSNSVVLALEAGGRRFALTFGYGFGAIDRSLVEPDFGLRVALNVVNPRALDTLNTRTLDRVTKQTRTHLNIGRPVEEFGIEPDLDWLRSVRGKAENEYIAGRLEGADSVGMNWDGTPDTLGNCCERLLELYESESYKTYFGFVDHVRALRSSEAVTSVLDQRVHELLLGRDTVRLTIAHPDMPAPDVETFRIWCGRVKKENVEELDLDVIFEFLDECVANGREMPDVQKIWIVALDGQGMPRSQRVSLWKYLTAQVELDDETYVLSAAQWFRTDRDYIRDLRGRVAAIPDITDELDLPMWDRGVKEGTYNAALAEARDWLLLDRQMFTFDEAANRIECADIMTPDGDFVHVKSMESSATLSHLFGQGTVSARLFRAHGEYRRRVEERFRRRYGTDLEQRADLRVVFAIGTPKDGPLSESLFFFSLVNLAQHKQMLDAMGYRVAVCKIGREPPA